jgi:hypothetical protein
MEAAVSTEKICRLGGSVRRRWNSRMTEAEFPSSPMI